MHDCRQFARLLAALSDETRLALLGLLVGKQDLLNVEELMRALLDEYGIALSQPTVSHHLRILRDSGLIDYKRIGLYHYYRLNNDRYDSIVAFLQELVFQRKEAQLGGI